jgi:hypothetical protein
VQELVFFKGKDQKPAANSILLGGCEYGRETKKDQKQEIQEN